jgi:hypothetical protein
MEDNSIQITTETGTLKHVLYPVVNALEITQILVQGNQFYILVRGGRVFKYELIKG